MPAIKSKNFRSGDLAEQLGVYLIQSVALVAPVPRTEDVGLDVVATLMTDHDMYSYIAEDSFFVQIKSAQIGSIVYKKHEVKWLSRLKLPFFIAAVDKIESKIRLYSCSRVYDALALSQDRNQLTLILEDEEVFKKCDFIDVDHDEVYLGPPVFEWSVNDLMKDEQKTRNDFYKIVKAHIKVNNECRELCEIGCGTTYIWQTNELPKQIGWKSCNASHIDFDLLSEKTLTHLCKMLDMVIQTGNYDVVSDIESVMKDYKEIYKFTEAIRDKRKDGDGELQENI